MPPPPGPTALTTATGLIEPAGRVAKGRFGYVLDGRLNDSFEAVNLLLADHVAVRRVDRPADAGTRPGDFAVAASAAAELVASVARETGVDFNALDTDPTAGSRALSQSRIGMYQRYFGGNMDAGWTRWLLADFSVPYTTPMDAHLTAGAPPDHLHVLLLPAAGGPARAPGWANTLAGSRASAAPPNAAVTSGGSSPRRGTSHSITVKGSSRPRASSSTSPGRPALPPSIFRVSMGFMDRGNGNYF